MINNVLQEIISKLNKAIDTETRPDDTVFMANIAFADPNIAPSSPQRSLNNKIVASVVNIEEEKTLKNHPRIPQNPGSPTEFKFSRAPIYLNLYVLFSANNDDYSNALLYLSRIFAFFHKTNSFELSVDSNLEPIDVLGRANANLVKIDLRVNAELCSLNFQELNQLWGILGGKYIPSVMYKLRVLELKAGEPQGSGLIQSIRLDKEQIN